MTYRPLPTPEVRLVAILGPPVVAVADLVDAARAAADGGVTAIQLRAKDLPALETLRLAETLVLSVPVPVYVNDRADVAVAAGARGVHVGADDLLPRGIRAWAPSELRVGVSVGDAAEADAARREPADYWSVGPAFGTATKPDAGEPIGPSGVGALARLAPPGVPVIAIGGIAGDGVGPLVQAGVVGVAASAAIFAAPDVRRAAHDLRDAIDEALSVDLA